MFQKHLNLKNLFTVENIKTIYIVGFIKILNKKSKMF